MVVARLEGVKVIPTGGALGAEIRGVDLSKPLPADAVASIRQALRQHCLIYFRKQRISERNQVDFTRHFGIPVEHVRKQMDRPIKEIFLISNLKKNGEPIGALSNEEIGFHSDLSYLPQPGTISTLYAVELPEGGGGATQWCNGYAAYDALDDGLKARLRGLRAVHRHSVEAQNRPYPVSHPLACTHPETGRKALYLGPHLTKYVVGLESSESRRLLDLLFSHIALPRFVWTHHWQIDDLVIWDNRCTMHRRQGFPSRERRLLKRTQVFNDQTPRE